MDALCYILNLRDKGKASFVYEDVCVHGQASALAGQQVAHVCPHDQNQHRQFDSFAFALELPAFYNFSQVL